MTATTAVKKVRSGISTAFAWIVIMGFIYAGCSAVHSGIWGEQEGIVKSEDCRIQIPLQENSSKTWFKTFTCQTFKSKSGKVVGGTCTAVETEGGACKVAYTYNKKPEIHCTDPNFPNPGYDDMCHANSQ